MTVTGPECASATASSSTVSSNSATSPGTVTSSGAASATTVPAQSAPPADEPRPWWRDAVIYQVYVRSFADGNGDGVGDLLGIRTRLPYLRELGVDAVWITPFYPSPMADGGYDVADYCAVDPLFGTLGDFDALVAEAHGVGLRVIVDLVPNHSSDRHRWFAEALAAGRDAAARDRYIFRPGKGERGELPPNDWESVFGGPAWTRTLDHDGTPGDWYLHLFDSSQPDLNWRDPAVRAQFEQILGFWLDRGVDGFRVDVAHGMIKHPDLLDVGRTGQLTMLGSAVLPYFDQDDVHDIHRSWRRILDGYPGGRIAVAEAWAPSLERLAAYVRPDELHQAFNFHYLTTPWDAEALRAVIDRSLRTAGLVGAPSTWVLSNHDVQRHVTRYGGGPAGVRRARAAALLMLALPGSAYVYQGEELGLEEVLDLPTELLQDPQRLRSTDGERGRDGCRVPLPWSGSAPPFSFTPLNIVDGWLPAPAHWAELTVEAQWHDPGSMLGLYREALRLRREHPALGDGNLEWTDSPDGTLVFSREPRFVCTVNTGDEDAAVRLPAPGTVLLASGPIRQPAPEPMPVPTSESAPVLVPESVSVSVPVPVPVPASASESVSESAFVSALVSASASAGESAAVVVLPPDTAVWWTIDR
ncbi:MAG TPA: glycoside hydrolase family 13 protein [Actinocrinis sp.]|uniref:glycoside hydrolase family 13 protein n=1 Tax=Actinocrinis sp. TaxID=1920516 RepID=UPI002DDD7D09|nr:glycoside hydrolase family 13 protein [Actinocrinis sp.]HEV2344170.1 glycoside hydrolase family 13 protein [Actinocrinis sp.]